ncbi:MAG: phage replisome organizer N-terminal domain-containing protein, partial [Bacteroidales bacterium]|nr:phage replisome organizer N-terminal domain-containing protein [Bacteroidales bacterium]
MAIAKESPIEGQLLLSENLPLTIEDIADEAAVDTEEVEQAIERFKEQNMLHEEDGVFVLTNWDSRQFVSDTSTERVRKHRQRKSETLPKRFGNNEVTPPDTDTKTDTETDLKDPPALVGDNRHDEDCDEGAKPGSKSGSADYSSDFQAFWAVYPRKREKRGAFRVWKARIREKVKPAALIAAAKNYAAAMQGKDARFTKLPTTFLGPDKPYEEWINGIPEPPDPSTPTGTTDYYEKVYLT